MTSSTSTRANNLGPLTTTFTPPSTCSVLGVVDPKTNVGFQGQHCFTVESLGSTTSTTIYPWIQDDFTCWPSTTSGVPVPEVPLNGWGLYSPGLVCPVGYETACVGAVNANGSPGSLTSGLQFNFQFPLTAGETGAGCCPSNYFCTTAAPGSQTCVSHITSTVMKVTQCVDSTATSTFDITVPTKSMSTFSAGAPMFQLVWQANDKADVTIIGTTATVTVTSTGGSVQKQSSGLDTGDKAGIGVGVFALLLLVLATVLGWLLLRKRKQAGSNEKYQDDLQGHLMSSGGLYHHGPPAREVSGTPLNELDGTPELADHGSEAPGG